MNDREIIISEKEPYCCGALRTKKGSFYSVNFLLEETDVLAGIAEYQRRHGCGWLRGRYSFGGIPKCTSHDYDMVFTFRLEINDIPKDHIGIVIRYFSTAWTGEEYSGTSEIELLPVMQRVALKKIDRQCKKLYGKSCEELLEEAKERMG